MAQYINQLSKYMFCDIDYTPCCLFCIIIYLLLAMHWIANNNVFPFAMYIYQENYCAGENLFLVSAGINQFLHKRETWYNRFQYGIFSHSRLAKLKACDSDSFESNDPNLKALNLSAFNLKAFDLGACNF